MIGLWIALGLAVSCAPRHQGDPAASRAGGDDPILMDTTPTEADPSDAAVSDSSSSATNPIEAQPPEPETVRSDEPPQPPPAPTVLHPFPHVEVRLEDRVVLFDGIACLDAGWLEFIVCTPGTKEHESLIVTRARPSHIHAALLLIGLKQGAPGRWVYEDDRVATIAPTGDEVIVEVIYTTEDGRTITEPIRRWIRDHLGEDEFPDRPWVFGGSRMRQAPPDFGVSEIYEADYSGSVIGLVTFGDEMLCFPDVMPDQVDIRPPEWEVNTRHVPKPGTPVTVVLRPAIKE